MYNPCIRGWINYYSHFYKTQLRPILKRIDAYVSEQVPHWDAHHSVSWLGSLTMISGLPR